MPRPRGCRRVAGPPGCVLFKPAGVPASRSSEIVLGIDELEALRLADLEGLYQEDAAKQMNVSRQTFGRIVSSARKNVAQALVQGRSLRIEGGAVEMAEQRAFESSGRGMGRGRGAGKGKGRGGRSGGRRNR